MRFPRRIIGRIGGSGRRAARLQAILMGTALTAASAAGVAGVWQGAAPAAADFFQDTALLAGAATMPEGTLGALRRQLTPSPSSAVTAEISPGITFTDPEPEVTDQKPVSVQPPEISPEYRGVLISETMAGSPSAVCWQIGAGWLRNYTEIPRTQIDAELSEPLELAPKADGRVEVLIMHTHATESYEGYDSEYYDTRNTWRSTDNNENMVAVGNVIEEELRKAGIGVVHDTQQFDYPSYNGSYDRAAVAVKEYLAQYPDIQLILDVHRDGIQRDTTTIVKPATEIDGEPAAQIMILCGSDPGVGDWGENLRTAAAVTNLLESRYPTLTRPIYFSTGRYNMDLSGGTILLEFGSQANTLEEALTSARLTGQALGEWLQELAGNA
ncbi:MAG: stage II sporulation protein P [Clostridiales bacterium]|nr:stage II sporulation protein P [Clostridiales bacterium]